MKNLKISKSEKVKKLKNLKLQSYKVFLRKKFEIKYFKKSVLKVLSNGDLQSSIACVAGASLMMVSTCLRELPALLLPSYAQVGGEPLTRRNAT